MFSLPQFFLSRIFLRVDFQFRVIFTSLINSKETQQATKRSLDINVICCFLCLAEVLCTHSIENVGPAHSAATAELREHGDEFTAEDFDGNDLTGGNLKLLTRSLKALTREDKPEELDVALDVRPTLVQASNLLVRRQYINRVDVITVS